MEILNNLQKIGLTKNEVDVYVFLLKNSATFGSDIHTTLGIDKSSCYRAINNLLKLKLIEKSGESKNKMFFINDSKNLDDLIDKKETEILSIKKSFRKLLSEIKKDKDGLYKQENIQIYNGIEGYKLFNEQRLRGNHKYVKELGTRLFIEKIISSDEYYSYMNSYIKRRIKKGIKMHTLFDISEENDSIDITDEKLLKESRQYPNKLDLGAFITIFGNYFGYYTCKNNKFMGVIVFDPLLTRLIESMYDVIWSLSKPVF